MHAGSSQQSPQRRTNQNALTPRAFTHKQHAAVWGVVAALLALPFLGYGFLLIALALHSAHGGDFGGPGASPTEPDRYVGRDQLLVLVIAVLVDLLIGLLVYEWRRMRNRSS